MYKNEWGLPGSRWWTGRPGVLQSMGSQRVRHNWAIELNWTEGFPGGSGVKNPSAKAGDTGLTPDLADPTYLGGTEPEHHGYQACALEPVTHRGDTAGGHPHSRSGGAPRNEGESRAAKHPAPPKTHGKYSYFKKKELAVAYCIHTKASTAECVFKGVTVCPAFWLLMNSHSWRWTRKISHGAKVNIKLKLHLNYSEQILNGQAES